MTPHELVVVTDSLRRTATVWDHQATAVGAIAGSARGLGLNRLSAGVFQLIVSPYQALVTEVADRCTEGNQSMSEIAAALRKAAATYDEAERRNVAAATNVH